MNQIQSKKLFFPNLDGLRFFCFLSVFFFHSFATDYDYIRDDKFYKFVKYFLFANGNLGVNFFFALSGFLITFLLLSEKKNFTKIDIGNFYLRRILRIWPLFYACVIFGFFIFPVLKSLNGEVPNETARIGFYLTFLNNFDFIKRGLPDSSVLGVLWSVAIEEQFYVVWPLLFAFIPSKIWFWLFALIIFSSLIFRFIHFDNPMVLEHHTFACISDMAVGGVAALLSFNNTSAIKWLRNAPKMFWILIYFLTFIIYIWRKSIFPEATLLAGIDRLVCSIIFALIILDQCFAKNSLFKMGKFKLVSKLGTFTYGLYCLHFIGILIAAKGLAKIGLNKSVGQVLLLEGGLSLALTILIAYFSFKYFETPFLKLKQRFAKITKGDKI